MNIATLAQIKGFVGVEGTFDDERLTLLGEMAEAQVTSYLGWEVWKAEREFIVDLPIFSTQLILPVLQLNDIETIVSDEVEMDYTHFTSSGQIYYELGFSAGRYVVTADTGYETIPYDLIKAVCLLVSNAYHQTQALSAENLGDRSQSYEAGLPSQVKQLLDMYRHYL